MSIWKFLMSIGRKTVENDVGLCLFYVNFAYLYTNVRLILINVTNLTVGCQVCYPTDGVVLGQMAHSTANAGHISVNISDRSALVVDVILSRQRKTKHDTKYSVI